MADMKLIKDMSAALNAKPKQPSPYDTTAEVVRVEGDTAWVHIPGGVDETPVQMSVNAKIGDTVRVRVGGGTAWLTGNDTAPPTDDEKANGAQATADEALLKINTIEAINIFADMIKTGAISADYIEGGTLTLGSEENRQGIMYVYNEDNILSYILSCFGFYALPSSYSYVETDSNARITSKDGVVANSVGTKYGQPLEGEYYQLASRMRDGKLQVYGYRGAEASGGLIPPLTYRENPLFTVKADVTKDGTYDGGDSVEALFCNELILKQSDREDFTTTRGSHTGTTIATVDGNGITMASGKTINGVDIGSLGNSVSTTNMASTTSVSSGTNTTLCNTGSLSPGTYILNATAIFPEASGGYRRIFFATSSSGNAMSRFARVNAAPVSGADTDVKLTTLVTISSATTYYLRAYQNSGSSLSVETAGIQVLKIHA